MLGFLFYAQRGTRTLKPFGMRPSNARVYQFRHLRENSLQRGKTATDILANFFRVLQIRYLG